MIEEPPPVKPTRPYSTYFASSIHLRIRDWHLPPVYGTVHNEPVIVPHAFEPLGHGHRQVHLHPITHTERLLHLLADHATETGRFRMITVLVNFEHLEEDVRLGPPIHAPQVHVEGGVFHMVLGDAVRKAKVEDVVATPTMTEAGIWNQRTPYREAG